MFQLHVYVVLGTTMVIDVAEVTTHPEKGRHYEGLWHAQQALKDGNTDPHAPELMDVACLMWLEHREGQLRRAQVRRPG